jgi:hypothetical protein
MLINSMPTASTMGATVERDDMSAAAMESRDVHDARERHYADRLTPATADTV